LFLFAHDGQRMSCVNSNLLKNLQETRKFDPSGQIKE